MTTLIEQPPGGGTSVRAVRARPCPLCQAPAGQPCQVKPEGLHLARFMDGYTAGQLTRDYMLKVLGELVVIHARVVVDPVTGKAGESPETILATLLAAGHAIGYAQDPVWGGWFADLRDSDGRLVDTGLGATQPEAREHLARRLAGAR